MNLPDKNVLDMTDEEMDFWHQKIKVYNDEIAAEYENCRKLAGNWKYSKVAEMLVCDGNTVAGERMRELEEILDKVIEWDCVLSDRDWINSEKERIQKEKLLRENKQLAWQKLANDYAEEFAGKRPENPDCYTKQVQTLLDKAISDKIIIKEEIQYRAISPQGQEILNKVREILSRQRWAYAIYPQRMIEWLDKKALGFKSHREAVTKALNAGEIVEQKVIDSIDWNSAQVFDICTEEVYRINSLTGE